MVTGIRSLVGNWLYRRYPCRCRAVSRLYWMSRPIPHLYSVL